MVHEGTAAYMTSYLPALEVDGTLAQYNNNVPAAWAEESA